MKPKRIPWPDEEPETERIGWDQAPPDLYCPHCGSSEHTRKDDCDRITIFDRRWAG